MAKWKVFKERVHPYWIPMWVVWDEYGEYLFRTGSEALRFVDEEISNRSLACRLAERQAKF